MKKSVLAVLVLVLVLVSLPSRELRANEDLRAAFESGDTVKILKLLADDPQAPREPTWARA